MENEFWIDSILGMIEVRVGSQNFGLGSQVSGSFLYREDEGLWSRN